MAKDTVEVLIEGGSATPGPPLGPALGPFGINMMQVVEEINKKSADFAGMKVISLTLSLFMGYVVVANAHSVDRKSVV